ncbi:MAG: DUF6776 family protein [Shewanella sp.]
MANFRGGLNWLQRMDHYRPSSIHLAILVLVAFLLGAGGSYSWLNRDTDSEPQEGSLEGIFAEQETQTQQLAARNLELAVAQEANAQMQQMFGEQLKKEQELQRELAFYRSLMKPDDNAEGVAIHGLEMTQGARAEEYHLKLILAQLQKRKQAIQGLVELTLIGQQAGKPLELNVNKLTGAKLAFDFRYFQVIDTPVTVPAGFNLQQVKVKVLVPASRWTKNSQTQRLYSLPELIAGEKEPAVILEQNSQVTDNLPQKTDVRGSND